LVDLSLHNYRKCQILARAERGSNSTVIPGW